MCVRIRYKENLGFQCFHLKIILLKNIKIHIHSHTHTHVVHSCESALTANTAVTAYDLRVSLERFYVST